MDEKEEKNWPLVRAKIDCKIGMDAAEKMSDHTAFITFCVLGDIIDYLEQKESKNGRN